MCRSVLLIIIVTVTFNFNYHKISARAIASKPLFELEAKVVGGYYFNIDERYVGVLKLRSSANNCYISIGAFQLNSALIIKIPLSADITFLLLMGALILLILIFLKKIVWKKPSNQNKDER